MGGGDMGGARWRHARDGGVHAMAWAAMRLCRVGMGACRVGGDVLISQIMRASIAAATLQAARRAPLSLAFCLAVSVLQRMRDFERETAPRRRRRSNALPSG